ncbi:MAG: cytochrome oxidase subunit III [Bacteroidetes bacterium]|nr:MAG: cytochrome oxidase subunit III [Bacteroidota bacterium]
MSTTTLTTTPYLRSTIHPLKFALWVACGSMLMVFAALTSAYVVRHASGNWLEFQMPRPFFYSTIVMLLSSVTLHIAYNAFKNGKENLYKSLLVVSMLLALGFLYTQYLGWMGLESIGLPLKTNASGDFVYALSWLHAGHVLGGVAALLVATIVAFSMKFKVTAARKLRFELTLTYWHFVDFLWVYLFLFFLLQ